LITTRWFSSSLSDPTSRWAPCPPESRRWWLQVSLSVSRLSPSCLSSLSIPSHPLWPVRHYPHLRISARGLGLSGTSTHLNALAVRHTLRQSLTSPDRASAATAPRLPAADRPPRGAFGRPGDLPVPVQGACVRARFSDHAGSPKRLRWRSQACCLPLHRQRRHPESVFYRGSMVGLHVPLPTLRRHSRECLRTARGRCGSLLLHRSGLAPPTPCRSPGAPV
jgi:hypothetical protein